jgi:CheY-like chemotaxis protein
MAGQSINREWIEERGVANDRRNLGRSSTSVARLPDGSTDVGPGEWSSVLSDRRRPAPGGEVMPMDRVERRMGGGDRTILVVEDDDDVRMLVIEMLCDLGYTVLTASDGPSALDILRQSGRIDLLFTDLVMPGGLSGTELADAAMAMRPTLKVLLTSGYIGHPLLGARPLASTDAFIAKPYRPAKLAQKIRGILSD